MENCRHGRLGSYTLAHHLIYKEELKKDGEKKVLCLYCNKPIWGSLYNCVECLNRPVHIYSSVNNHCLDFTEKLENEVVCSFCDEPLLGPAYKCPVSKCNFVIHKSCTQLSLKIYHPLHPKHNLFLRDPDGNCCDACCRSHEKSFFYSCRFCGFQLDIECANHRLPINPNDCHQHEFFPIWKKIQFNCEACGEEITNLTYKVCNICKLLVHYRCAKIPRTVKINLHNHFLSLIYSPHEIKKRGDMFFCRICHNKVNTEYAAYYCHECNYILHTECLRHFIDMYGESPATSGLVLNKSVRYTTHRIKALNHAKDEGPHPKEINHFSHQQHKLFLYDDEVKDDKVCNGCMEFITSAPFYSCEHCNFFLHIQCTKLPTTIEQHRLDNFHTLTLLPWAPTKSGVFFCSICSRHQRGFTYKCDEYWCKNTFDSQCGSIPKTLQHEGHQHNLFLPPHSNRTCKACPKDNKKYVFVCTNCDFTLGFRCANLPLVVRHKYDTHLLKLTYVTKEDSREYYCLICEGERDPNHWFYYCEKCDFPAHPECIIGNYPCITIGSTYKSEYHEHPLTFVQKTGDSICDACRERFDDVALECPQCNFSVHPPRPYFPDCMWKRSERQSERGW